MVSPLGERLGDEQWKRLPKVHSRLGPARKLAFYAGQLGGIDMARLQLALNVGDLDAAIDHYTKMFGVGPAKVRDGYANFAIENPPLKLVLIAGHGQPGTMNHVGVELESPEHVAAKIDDARARGFDITVHESETCCFAVQDKVWINSGEVPWEWYTVLDDAPNDTSLATSTVNPGKKPLLMVEANGNACGPDTCC